MWVNLLALFMDAIIQPIQSTTNTAEYLWSICIHSPDALFLGFNSASNQFPIYGSVFSPQSTRTGIMAKFYRSCVCAYLLLLAIGSISASEPDNVESTVYLDHQLDIKERQVWYIDLCLSILVNCCCTKLHQSVHYYSSVQSLNTVHWNFLLFPLDTPRIRRSHRTDSAWRQRMDR